MHALKNILTAGLTACATLAADPLFAAALSAPYRLNAHTPGNQELRHNVTGANGDKIVLWRDYGLGSTFIRRFDAAGYAIGGEINAGPGVTHVAIDAQGNFALLRQAPDQRALYVRQYRRDGSARTGEALVNYGTGYNARGSNMVFLSTGELVVYFSMAANSNGTSVGFYAKAFDTAGQALGWETRLAAGVVGAAADAQGNVITTSEEINPQDGAYDVYVARRDKFGYQIGDRIRVNSYVPGHQSGSKVALARDGSFVVAWNSYGQEGGSSAYGQRFAANFARIGGEFRFNPTFYPDGQHTGIDIAMLGDGRLVATWYSSNRWVDPAAPTAIHLRQYQPNGTAGAETRINASTDPLPRVPLISLAQNGLYSVAWQHYNTAGGDYDVMHRWFAVD